ncbi:hypothetical protein [Streptomyces sp. NPDC002133]|uniref:hypothetical protein n=1 Tax=Streptomyces sp. NPDC002133 TaxID=3154409 RepID=UPI00332941E3
MPSAGSRRCRDAFAVVAALVAVLRGVLLGRFGRPEEIAGAVAYLGESVRRLRQGRHAPRGRRHGPLGDPTGKPRDVTEGRRPATCGQSGRRPHRWHRCLPPSRSAPCPAL